jgi:alpha-beta hydrolase superfamily lysophospholipase
MRRVALLLPLLAACTRPLIGPMPGASHHVSGSAFSFQTSDNITLSAYVLPAVPPVRGTVLLLHGFASDGSAFAARAAALSRAGYHAVAWDSRGHGRSGGYCTFGARERDDVSDLLDVLEASGLAARPRLLYGFSMGGAIAIRAAVTDRRIDGVIALAPYATALLAIRRAARGAPPRELARLLTRAERTAGFHAAEVRPIDDVRRLRVPLLVVAGTRDRRAPLAESFAITATSGGPSALLTIRGAGHDDLERRCGARCDFELGRMLRDLQNRTGTPEGVPARE